MGHLFLPVQPHVLDIPDILGIPGMLPGSDRGPWVQGHYSSVWGHSTSSIALVGDDLVPFGHRIGCFHNRMDDFVWCFETGSVVHDLSIGRCYQLFDELKPCPRLFVSGLGRWEVLLLS